jgi:hypothetical protein
MTRLFIHVRAEFRSIPIIEIGIIIALFGGTNPPQFFSRVRQYPSRREIEFCPDRSQQTPCLVENLEARLTENSGAR